MQQLESDWLDALTVLVKVGRQELVRPLYHETDLVKSGRVLHAYLIRTDGVVAIDKGFNYLPHVERVEILVSVALNNAVRLGVLETNQLEGICKQVGCCSTATGTIRERWRQIIVELDPRDEYRATTLICRLFEDRAKCGWCSGPIITGSGSLVRKDLHEGCYDYIMKVVRPGLQARQKVAQ